MNVGVDLERLRNVHSGLGQFCLRLGQGLQDANDKDLHLHYYYPRQSTVRFDTASSEVSFADKLFGVRNKSLDLFHCTHQDSHLFPPKTPTIVTIHDLNFLEKYTGAKKASKLKAMQRMVNKAKGLVFISDYTRQLAAEHLHLPQVPQRVIYNGNCLATSVAPEKPAGIPDGEFLFAIGIVNPKKNFQSLLPLLKDTNYNLVIAGNATHPYAAGIVAEAAKMGLSQRVVLTGPVSEAGKYWLYSHCKALVFPSLAEGFGLPVVEAMSLGKPVFLSDRGSLPEVGGNLAYYWHSFEPEHMRNVLEAGLSDFEAAPQKPQQLRDWAAQFSWEKAAGDYIDFYKHVYTSL